MGSIALTFGLIPLLVAFVAIYAWAYKFVFNHEIIRNYSHGKVLSALEINALITECNRKYGLYLVSVEHEAPGEETLPDEQLYTSLKLTLKTSTDRIVGVVFASGFALSIELILVMLAQLTGTLEVNMSLVPLLIKILVIVVVLVQPFLVISLYINQALLPKPKLASPLSIARTTATIALLLLWFVVLDRFGLIAAPLGNSKGKTFLEEKTNDIVLAGVTITALLSGIGCALTPIRSLWLNRSKNGGKVSEKGEFHSINELTQTYNATQMLESKRQRELDALRQLNLGSVYNAPELSGLRLMKQSGSQLFNKVQSFTNLSNFGKLDSEEQELEREVASLNNLKRQVYSDLSQKLQTISRARDVQIDSRIGYLKLVRAFDYAFSVYCIYRMVNVLLFRIAYLSVAGIDRTAVRSAESGTEHTLDALAITIAKIIQSVFGYFPLSEAQLVNQISFLLSGSLFACSFQNVMITFKTLGRFLPSNTTLSNENIRGWLKNLIVSQLLAVYVIATALLIRSNLPLEAAQQMLKLLSLSSSGGTATKESMLAEVDFVDAWFDKVFGFTSVATLVVVALKEYIERDGGFGDDFDEEMMIEEQSRAKEL